ncbi:hypothetical protein JAAARDRAFT_127232 [Jaapia argillacea MUCL 33604]|uniref:Peptidase S1 domain-containing protein n=1 Tax=Jaapia argillacea MUCL 33604 TaxID=933084 RepID=A0A067Q0S7_9AGAM|nr:hypothetical protein JAAARDRAFT_127232 [Jaapia argillacea MUCL 33604]
MTEPTTSFVVTETLSKRYYRGLPSQPPLIATTRPGPFDPPTGPEAYTVLKELRELGDHPLAREWDRGLAEHLRRRLNTLGVNWTSIDALRIADVGEASSLVIVWIGVEFGALSFKEGSVAALDCRALIDSYGIHDYHVEIRESRVMRLAGNRFLDPVPLSDPTFTARNPYTATLGIPISTKNRPWAEGSGGFYLGAGGDDKNIYLVTARHVVLPLDKNDNKEYERKHDSGVREDVVVLGTSGFNEKLTSIDYEIRGQEFAITDAEERVELVKGIDDPASVRELRKAERASQEAKEGLKALKAFRLEITTSWEVKEMRVFGELTWAPPIILSTEPGQYTLDLAVVKIDAGLLDDNNYRGNAINIGTKYSRHEFMDKVSTCFKFPGNRLVPLQGQVPESDLVNPLMSDANGESCLIVFKNGPKTDTTIGKANNVSSYTRIYFASEYRESREWPVIPTNKLAGSKTRFYHHPNKHSGAFSAKGDSGCCVADVSGRVGGIITGGSGANENSDVTYVTPISFIIEVLHSTKRFQHAHLYPVLV